MGPIGWQELLILAVIGILIFGKRLPEVGRSVGKSIVEFKKGLAGVDEEIDAAVSEKSKQVDTDTAHTTEAETHATAGGAA
ncbi:MAG: twin-arginine translocase TatA/TatE family subunit [Phycisphaeraceae bacterium]|nr:twin-arginine translocase TatA/TatE family subunit [Phycisphaeraceae bacterium]